VNGWAKTSEATALIARTARHFAHKVPVETSDGYASIETRFGRAELEARGGGVAIVLAADDTDSLESLREVIETHLVRFARAPIEIAWADGTAPAA
jgi:hypothetical protein